MQRLRATLLARCRAPHGQLCNGMPACHRRRHAHNVPLTLSWYTKLWAAAASARPYAKTVSQHPHVDSGSGQLGTHNSRAARQPPRRSSCNRSKNHNRCSSHYASCSIASRRALAASLLPRGCTLSHSPGSATTVPRCTLARQVPAPPLLPTPALLPPHQRSKRPRRRQGPWQQAGLPGRAPRGAQLTGKRCCAHTPRMRQRRGPPSAT
jgi:hypothetical protein